MSFLPSRIPLAFLAALALGAAPAARAQSAHWDPPGGTLPVGEVAQLQLVFDGCSPDDTPVPPKVDGLRLDFQGQSSNISIINGSFSRTVSLAYAVLLSKAQDVDIPAFSVDTNKGKVQVPAAHFSQSGATVGASGISVSDAVSSKLTPSPDSVWAGEIFDLKYTIDVGEDYYPNWGRGTFEWDPSPLVIEDWTQPEPYDLNASGPRKGLAYRTRAIARAPGRITLNPPSQLVSLSVGVSGFGFFQQRQYQQFSVAGNSPVIEVRPLPPAPTGFTGAVGDFKIASKIVPTRVKTGEPITWTVELDGSGNWPEIRGLPSREASSDFQVVQPKPRRTLAPGKLFEGTLSEDVVLVPTKAGSYDLPALDFSYFDPKSGSYKVVTAPGGTVTVDPPDAVAAPAAVTLPGAPGGPAPGPEAKAPEVPTAALGDPLPQGEPAPMPIRIRTLALECAVPVLLLGFLWMIFALRRALMTDPLRPRRRAYERLGGTLLALRTAPAAGKAPLLIAWQRDTAVLWGIEHAAPASSALSDPEWSSLWSEADRCLYSADGSLSPDWAARASTALAGKAPRAFSPARLFLPRNLFPFLAALLVASLAQATSRADPIDTYKSGHFSAASIDWAGRVSANPLDWASRHDLSLALAQQDRWAEAAAQSSAAFVQNPSNPAVRRQLALACDKAEFIPEPLDFLTQPGPVQSLARLESPGAWERTGLGACVAAAAALAVLLGALYGTWRHAPVVWSALGVLVAALLVGAASFVAYRAYGIMADSRAVIVLRSGSLRSIPTEADVSQKTTPLSAGTSAIADKSFIGWIRLTFPNGQTGWVQRSEVVYVWTSPLK